MSTRLLTGGAVYSPAAPGATALAVTSGTVSWVGEDAVGRALHPDAEVVDLDGAFVAPAFVDTHVHATSAGLALLGLDLTGAHSLRECLDLVRAHALAHPTGILWGHGWDDSRWPEQRPPTRAEVDDCAHDRQVYLSRIDVHSALVSTPLLRCAAGVAAAPGWSTEAPLSQQAHHLVRDAARGGLGPEERAAAQHALLDHAAAHGVACVHECGGAEIAGVDDFRELLAMEHGVSVRGYWGEAVTTPEQARDVVVRTGAHGLGGDLFVDGSLGSRTAWLTKPYRDDPHSAHNTGARYLDTDRIAAHLRACTQAGVQGGFHVIGDGAVAAVVAALGRVVAELGGPAVAARGHRLEHLEMVDAGQAAKLGAWGVLASVQPVFDAQWGGTDGAYAQRLGPVRGPAAQPAGHARGGRRGARVRLGHPRHPAGSVGGGTGGGTPPHPGPGHLPTGGIHRGHPRGVAGRRRARRAGRHPGPWGAGVVRGVGRRRAGGGRPQRLGATVVAGPPLRSTRPASPGSRRRAAPLPAAGAPRDYGLRVLSGRNPWCTRTSQLPP